MRSDLLGGLLQEFLDVPLPCPLVGWVELLGCRCDGGGHVDPGASSAEQASDLQSGLPRKSLALQPQRPIGREVSVGEDGDCEVG